MLYTAFILGLISSLHCIGMCGPIAMMLPVSHKNTKKKALQIITYHLGRILSYAFIGLLFGIIGRGFYLAGIQQCLSVFAGLTMIIIIVIPVQTFAKYNFSTPLFHLISRLKNKLGKQFTKTSFQSVFSIGILNGLLPCGMVYVAVFGALTMSNLYASVFYMALFGFGTVPLMSGVVYLQKLFPMRVRNKIQKVIPVAVVFLGILFILRGMGLSIPYISPEATSLFVKAKPSCHG